MSTTDDFWTEGSGLLDRYEQEGDPQILARARAVWERAVAETVDRTARAAFLNNLAYALRLSHEATGYRGDLARALEACEEAIALTESDTPSHAMYLDAHALGLRDRYDLDGNPADLDRAIELHERAVAGDPDQLLYLNNLAGALCERYLRTLDRADLVRALDLFRDTVEHTDPEAPERPMRLSNLATALVSMFELTRERTLLYEAVTAARSAVAASPAGAIDRSRQLAQLGRCLSEKFREGGDRSDLDAGIEAYRAAVAASDKGRRGIDLGHHLLDRYGLDVQVEDLNEVIEVATAVVDAVRLKQPARAGALFTEAAKVSISPTYLHDLGVALIDRYKAEGRVEDLDAAIDAAEQATALMPEGSHWQTLGNALRLRYDITGAPELLDRAVAAHLSAVDATDPVAPTWVGRSHDLGNALLDRYRRIGSLADLDEAIRLFVEAPDAMPERSPERAIYLSNAGNGLWTRYWHTRNADDLDRAVAAFEQAVALCGDDPIYLDNLANALSDRAMRNGDGDDLANALEAHRSAVSRFEPGAPELPRCLTNLGTTLWVRYQAYGERPDLDEAIVIQQRAVATTPEASPDLPMRLNNLALVIRERADATDDPTDRALAGETYRRASLLALRSDPLWAMQSALNCARWCDERTDWPEAAEAYELALNGMNRLYGSQRIRSHKELMLSATKELASAAAYAIARAGQPVRAVQAAERARALMLSEALELPPPDLRAALTSPGFDAVVYLISVADGGLALVQIPDREAFAVLLPKLDEASVRSCTGLLDLPPAARHGATDHVGRWLWTAMAQPLLDVLPPDTTAVALIAVGALGLLPLHAAWTPDSTHPAGRRYLIDHCAVSYQPNARLLGRVPGTASRLLAVVNPDGSLPSAGHEFTAVAARAAETVQLAGPAATKEAVLAAMPTADVHHFACHGYARPQAPLDSAIVLAAGEPLALRDILQLRLDVRLAVLSACHTHIPGHHLPDEVISLPTALLQAGVHGVIASHWEVSGMAVALLMSRFYQHWYADRKPPSQALRQAQRWLRDTTNAEKIADLHPTHDRWARRRLMARPPQARDFTAPGIWASFSHTGI